MQFLSRQAADTSTVRRSVDQLTTGVGAVARLGRRDSLLEMANWEAQRGGEGVWYQTAVILSPSACC